MREVVQPTVPREDRDAVLRRATSRVRSTVTAYDDVLITSNAHNVTNRVTLAVRLVAQTVCKWSSRPE